MTAEIFAVVYAVAGLVAFVLLARSEARRHPNPSSADEFGNHAVALIGAMLWPLALTFWAAAISYRLVTRDIR